MYARGVREGRSNMLKTIVFQTILIQFRMSAFIQPMKSPAGIGCRRSKVHLTSYCAKLRLTLKQSNRLKQ